MLLTPAARQHQLLGAFWIGVMGAFSFCICVVCVCCFSLGPGYSSSFTDHQPQPHLELARNLESPPHPSKLESHFNKIAIYMLKSEPHLKLKENSVKFKERVSSHAVDKVIISPWVLLRIFLSHILRSSRDKISSLMGKGYTIPSSLSSLAH